MEEKDYPALYQAADVASFNAQKGYLNNVKAYIALSVLGAGLSVVGIQSKEAAILAAIVFLGGLFISIYIAVKKNENVWFRARAVAESIKTSTWRFMMQTEPFDASSEINKAKSDFRDLLKRILNEHKDLAHDLAGSFSLESQITTMMDEVRSKSLDERKNIYLNQRIEDQRKWYTDKSNYNKKWGKIWFVSMIALQAIAIILTLMRVAYPQWSYWPTEIFIVAAAGIFTWIQLKRFRELTASYGLAAHEIGLAMGALDDVHSEEDFSDFVRDTENAFSREHTQWVAKKE
jgi:hypothetical protein